MMDWEYELNYPIRVGFTRVSVINGGKMFTRYVWQTFAEKFVASDPFHFPELPYYWEDARLALLPSAEQYAARKRTNAPTD